MHELMLPHSMNGLIYVFIAITIRVSHNHLRGGGSTAPPLGWGPCVEEQLSTSEGSSLYPLMSTYRKENLKGKLCCVDCTKTVTQYMSLDASDQGFLNGMWHSLSLELDGKFYLGNFA